METHNRRSIRLKGYDYSQSGLYFITICCHNRQYRFGEIQNGKMILNDNGKIAVSEWKKLNERFYGIKQGAFVVMPNHIHFIIIITQPVVWAGLAPAPISTDNPVGATLAVARINPTVARMDETDRNEMNDREIVREGFTPARNTYDRNNISYDRETVMAGFTPARDNTDETIHNETETYDRTRNEKDDREGRPNEPDESNEPNEPVGAGLAPAQNETVDINQYKTIVRENKTDDREGRPNGNNGLGNEGDRKGRPNDTDRKIALGEIVGAYKSLVFNNCLKLAKEKGEYLGKFWQRDYFENIIQNDEAYLKISEYIIHNPDRWKEDKFY